ncbi:RNA polymerase sigma factor [Namhaeicola litoreus]|uniref:RNA polymerase sigma factor n=1 Tax=Namhaeicola litoreus TaxID=1052145 RepID=A0ABW3Y0F5_9FLAO
MESKEQYYIDKVLAGEKEYFSFLVDLYKNMAFTLALKMVKNREDAEELSQDSFVKAFQKLDTFKGEAKFSTWLYAIVYRNSISFLRKKKLDYTDLKSVTYKIAEESETSDPHNILKQEEQKVYVQKAIESLPETDAFLITLFYLNESSVEEIQEITGLSNSNVKTKLFRARKKLREALQVLLRHEMKSIV